MFIFLCISTLLFLGLGAAIYFMAETKKFSLGNVLAAMKQEKQMACLYLALLISPFLMVVIQ